MRGEGGLIFCMAIKSYKTCTKLEIKNFEKELKDLLYFFGSVKELEVHLGRYLLVALL